MATIAINYREMGNAAGDAGKVAKKLTTYANAINNTVLNKLNSYSGNKTGNISSAMSSARNKKNQLETDSERYSKYATELKNLEDECKRTDKQVAGRVKSLTGTFKDSHGIKTNAIADCFSRFMTSIANSNPVFRWIDNNVVDRIKEGHNYLKDRIKEWYNYDGGKQLLKGVAVAALEIAVAVAGIVVVFLGTVTGIGALIVAVAAVIGGVIAFANGMTNLINEVGAYADRQNGNASMGYRRSKLDTLTDTVRTFSDDKRVHQVANFVDGLEFVCNVIGLVDSVGGLLKNGYKWASGSLKPLEDLKLKDILTRSNIKDFGRKLKTDLLDGGRSIKAAFGRRDWEFFKNAGKSFGTDFMKSLKERYIKFDGLKDGLKSFKNIASFGKKFLGTDGFWGKSGAIVTEVVLPCINIAQNATAKTDGNGNFIRNNNVIVMDDPEKVSIDDIWSNMKKIFKTPFSDFPKLVDKFTGSKGPDISIPKIYVPPVNVQVNLNINIQPIHIPAGRAA